MNVVRLAFAIALTLAGVLQGMEKAHAAPKQLLNKSIVISWSDSVYQKYPDGQKGTATITRQRIAYISSAGRVFIKSQNSDRAQQLNREIAPGDETGSLAFKGDVMVSHVVFNGFARQLTVRFDASFTSCNATVVYGRSGGPRTWKSFDQKRTFEVETISAGSPSCSIRNGNAVSS